MMKKILLSTLAVTLATGLVATSVAEAREGRIRARGENGVAAAAAGPNGGAFARGRGAVQNQDGSVTSGSAGAIRTPQGARAVRGSTTTVNPDGSATRRSGFAAQSAQGGVVTSQGSSTLNADGTYSGARSTEATGPEGATYQGTTTYNPETGVVRSATCTDPTGAVVACPRQ